MSLTALIVASCSVDDPITSLDFSREFSPVDFKAEVVDKVNVNLTWTSPQPSDQYVIELFRDSVIGEVADSVFIVSNEVGTEKVPFVIYDLEPNTVYMARIKGVSEKKEDSKWTELTEPFETKKGEAPAPVPVTHKVTFTAGEKPAAWGDGKFVITPTDPDNKMVADANSCYFYEEGGQNIIHFDSRLKTGGKSSATKNFLTLTIPGDGKLYIYVRTGSNGDVTRTVNVTQNEEELLSYTLVEADMKTENVEVEGEPAPVSVYSPVVVDVKKGTATITYPVNGINFYGFTLISLDTDDEGGNEEDDPQVPVGEDGELVFDAAGDVADGTKYTFGSASLLISNSGAKITVDGNKQYFGDDTNHTQYAFRMKTGAKSSDTNGVALTLTAKGTITIAMRSSSSSAARNVSIVDAAGQALTTWEVSDSNAMTGVAIEGEAEPKTVFKYYKTEVLEAGTYNFTYDGGLNFYSLKYQP